MNFYLEFMLSGFSKSNLKKTCPIWVMLYILFIAFPHFDSFTHSHASKGQFHTHGIKSAHDLSLERAAFVALANGGSDVRSPVTSTEINESLLTPLEMGTQGLKPGGLSYHSHLQEHPNLLALGALVSLSLILLGILIALKLLPIPLVTQPLLNPSARGPPATLLLLA